jgi:NADPH:quinone reductase-like Zn-dependent oxidoreductase
MTADEGNRLPQVMVGGAMNGNWIRPLLPALMAIVISPFVSHTLALLLTRGSKEDLIIMQKLLEARTVTPVIDRTYPLSEAPEAIRYLEQGHARGKVVIIVGTA